MRLRAVVIVLRKDGFFHTGDAIIYRNIYAASALSIKPKNKLSKIDVLKEIIRAWGMNPCLDNMSTSSGSYGQFAQGG